MSHFPINNTTPGGKSSYKKGMTHKKYLIDENVIPVCPWKLCAKSLPWCVHFHLSHSSSKTLNPKFLHSEKVDSKWTSPKALIMDFDIAQEGQLSIIKPFIIQQISP
jgi:hypothetical protein